MKYTFEIGILLLLTTLIFLWIYILNSKEKAKESIRKQKYKACRNYIDRISDRQIKNACLILLKGEDEFFSLLDKFINYLDGRQQDALAGSNVLEFDTHWSDDGQFLFDKGLVEVSFLDKSTICSKADLVSALKELQKMLNT